jgi:hypothetical protein
VADIVAVSDVIREVAPGARIDRWRDDNPWPFADGKRKR